MTALKVLVCVLVVAVSVFAQERRAIAYVESTSNSPYAISGSVSFIQLGDSVVTVAVDIRGLPDGDYAIHVHEFGDLTDISGASAGPHFIGNGSATHGCPGTDVRHEGDMGSWTSEFGAIFQQKYLDLLQLSGNYSIVGRAVVVHQLVDSCSGESGNAGKRYAFGTIGIQNFHESQASQDYAAPLLVAKLYGTTNCNFCSGFVYFYQNINESTITVTAYVNGLVGNTVHGLHIHQYGDLTFGDGSYLGVHYNPTGNLHGLPIDDDRHAGDLGNIQNYDSTTGIAWYQYNTTIIESLANITGRGVIVHELQDNGRGFGCNTGTGNSGVRYIAGVIGIASNTTSVPAVPISIDNTWVDVDCEPLPVYTTGSTINGFTSHFTSELIVFTSVSSSSVLTISLLFSLIWVLMM